MQYKNNKFAEHVAYAVAEYLQYDPVELTDQQWYRLSVDVFFDIEDSRVKSVNTVNANFTKTDSCDAN